MRKIEGLINEYCAQNLPLEPAWIIILNRRFPKLAARFDSVKSVQWEIEDHLQSSFEASLSKGQNPENAWKNAKEHFGDLSLISKEICRARRQSRYCLLVRLLAMILLFALPLTKAISAGWFISGQVLEYMAGCIALCFLITRKRDAESIRRFALYGTWIALLWGIFQAITMELKPYNAGSIIAMILMSTFYGLFLITPAARGWIPATMFVLCQIGVLVPLMRVGLLSPYPNPPGIYSLKIAAAASIVTILVGLMVYDIRRLSRRLAGLAGFGMLYCYCQMLCNLTPSYAWLDFVVATSIPFLVAVLIILLLRKIQNCLLKESDAKIVI